MSCSAREGLTFRCFAQGTYIFEPNHIFRYMHSANIHYNLRVVWSDSSLGAFWIAKDAKFLHTKNEDSDQTVWTCRLIWDIAGRTCPDEEQIKAIQTTHMKPQTHKETEESLGTVSRKRTGVGDREWVGVGWETGLKPVLFARYFTLNSEAARNYIIRSVRTTVVHYLIRNISQWNAYLCNKKPVKEHSSLSCIETLHMTAV